ncbi:MAG: N-acetyl-gamma-glutamyl-phosphate reductase, partial [Chitinophagaceae bacterium]
LFLCVGHGEARQFLDSNVVNSKIKIIDLSQDFRLAPAAVHGDRIFVYGLPELQRLAISQASNVANPGCFATALQLGLLPLAQAHLLSDVYTTGITGSTGAGQGLSATSHFSWRANNIQAYKSLSHQHMGEVSQSLTSLQPDFTTSGENSRLNFVPWRGDFTRGIFVSSQLRCSASIEQLVDLYKTFFQEHLFTFVSKEPVSLKQVVNSNKCVIHLEKNGQQLVVHSAIDNLLKGASGQAVQNMNLMLGLAEDAGLRLKGIGF